MRGHSQHFSKQISALLIAGPTASGKSQFALSAAKVLNGVVINADSMQVYADLNILSARPAPGELKEAEHRLYGHVDGAVNYSVGAWLKDVEIELKRAKEIGKLPIIIGGTGLYFKALLEGLSPLPPVPDDIRVKVRQSLEGLAAGDIHTLLQAKDPIMAGRLRPSDTQRLTRALEVLEATGRSLSYWQDLPRQNAALDQKKARCFFIKPEREWVTERINARFDMMMAEGALDEVAALKARNLPSDLPVMRAHGVPGLITYLNGQCTKDEAIEKGKHDTRAYAKRQMTWFRNQCDGFEFISPEEAQAFVF